MAQKCKYVSPRLFDLNVKFINIEPGFSISAPWTFWAGAFWVVVGTVPCRALMGFSGLSLVDASSKSPVMTFPAISVLAVGKTTHVFRWFCKDTRNKNEIGNI